LHIALRRWNGWGAGVVASIVASVLFGVYHFAHSAPFNEVRMVLFLAGIGLAPACGGSRAATSTARRSSTTSSV
jgi:membrane protease YdiL (CAAX protease family)